MGPRTGLDVLEELQFLVFAGIRTSDHPASSVYLLKLLAESLMWTKEYRSTLKITLHKVPMRRISYNGMCSFLISAHRSQCSVHSYIFSLPLKHHNQFWTPRICFRAENKQKISDSL